MLQMSQVTKIYRTELVETHALRALDLQVNEGEFVAVTGPSGSGKSTLIKTINALEPIQKGEIWVDGQAVHDPKTDLPKLRSRVGMVFQKPTPFPMTIYENIAFGIRLYEKISKSEMDDRVEKALRGGALWNEVKDRLEKPGGGLSGGQQQRLCIARAIAVQPDVLLMDEPFGALDAKVRKELRRWLARLHEDVHLTSVFVTHDQEEAMEVADRIVVMNKGVIEQIGTPAEVYANPASEFVYHFLGDANRLQLDEQRMQRLAP